MKEVTFYEAVELAKNGELEIESPHWCLTHDFTGDTIAHYYVRHSELPLEFPHWELKNNYGISIAAAAVIYDTLPDGFHEQHHVIWEPWYGDLLSKYIR